VFDQGAERQRPYAFRAAQRQPHPFREVVRLTRRPNRAARDCVAAAYPYHSCLAANIALPARGDLSLSDRPTPVGTLLRAAPPDHLPEVVTEHLRHHFAAARVEVLLGDLTLTGLWPVLEPGGAAGGPLAQRCFGSQQPVIDVTPAGVMRLHLPISLWAERLGVLLVETSLASEG